MKIPAIIFAVSVICSSLIVEIHRDLALDLGIGERLALPLQEKQIIVASNENSTVLISFEEISTNKYNYKFRHFDRKSKKETTGEGELFELYEVEKDKNGNTEVNDAGGKIDVIAEDITIGWSRGEKGLCYLYYSPEKVSVLVVGKQYYEKFKWKMN